MKIDYSIEYSPGNEINITTYGNAKDSTSAIILVHGFKGFKDWGFFPAAAERLSQEFFVITFNFSLNGVGKNSVDFNELEKFSSNTFTRELNELEFMITKTREGYFGGTQFAKIGLLGHSRGGADVLAAAIKQKVDAVCTWSATANIDRYTERHKEKWRTDGHWDILNTRTKQMMRLNVGLLEDIEKISKSTFDFRNNLKSLQSPLLIVHGKEDLTVIPDEAELLYSWSNQSKTELKLINHAGHTFNIVHPMVETSSQFEEVIKITKDYFTKFL